MLDLGALRIGNDVYAEDDSGFGLTTLQRRHARRRGDTLFLRFVGKSRVEHRIAITDPQVLASVEQMRRRRGSSDLLSYRKPDGSRQEWAGLGSEQVNAYIREASGIDASAKDFRTWHATAVLAARVLAEEARQPTTDTVADPAGVARAAALGAAADLLGNTVIQARESYVDPRVLEAHADGRVLRPWCDHRDLELAVLELLREC